MPRLPKLVASVAIVLAISAPADARPDARTMSCAEVQALLAREGAAALTTGAHTYGRYVAPGACDGTGVAQSDSIVTRDTNQCAVYTCGPRTRRTD